MNARVKLSIEDAADIVYAGLPRGWRKPLVDAIAAEIERTERRCDADEHPGFDNGSRNWEAE